MVCVSRLVLVPVSACNFAFVSVVASMFGLAVVAAPREELEGLEEMLERASTARVHSDGVSKSGGTCMPGV